MASQTMELECPNCKLMLEIDIAFAGGVCRCSSCGTLMTVPRDPKLERAESLRRPDRPGAPAGSAPPERPAAPGRPDAPPGGQTPAPAAPDVSSARPDAPAGQQPPAAPAPAGQTAQTPAAGAPQGGQIPADAPVDEGVYVTASGKEVRITSQTRIPTAVKRKALKISIVTGFVIAMVGMIAIVLIGIAFMLSSDSSGKRTAEEVAADVQQARGNYDPDINPFLLNKHNVLGLDVASRVVVVMDTSNESNKWLSMAADAIIEGLVTQEGTGAPGSPGASVQVIFARDGGPSLAPEKLDALNDEARTAIKDALFDARARGQATLRPALTIAVASKPEQIVLITSQDFENNGIKDTLDELIQSKPSPKLDVIYLGQQPGDLQETVSAYDGKLVKLPVLTLRTWYQNWLDQQQAAPAE